MVVVVGFLVVCVNILVLVAEVQSYLTLCFVMEFVKFGCQAVLSCPFA